MPSGKHSAATSALGYQYQTDWCLLELLRRAPELPDAAISFGYTTTSRGTISVGPPSQEALGEARGTLGFRLPSPPPPSLAQRMTVKDAVWVVGSRPAV
jgi:hypothetical protein